MKISKNMMMLSILIGVQVAPLFGTRPRSGSTPTPAPTEEMLKPREEMPKLGSELIPKAPNMVLGSLFVFSKKLTEYIQKLEKNEVGKNDYTQVANLWNNLFPVVRDFLLQGYYKLNVQPINNDAFSPIEMLNTSWNRDKKSPSTVWTQKTNQILKQLKNNDSVRYLDLVDKLKKSLIEQAMNKNGMSQEVAEKNMNTIMKTLIDFNNQPVSNEQVSDQEQGVPLLQLDWRPGWNNNNQPVGNVLELDKFNNYFESPIGLENEAFEKLVSYLPFDEVDKTMLILQKEYKRNNETNGGLNYIDKLKGLVDKKFEEDSNYYTKIGLQGLYNAAFEEWRNPKVD